MQAQDFLAALDCEFFTGVPDFSLSAYKSVPITNNAPINNKQYFKLLILVILLIY